MREAADVVIIGAGVAGLAGARDLCAAGRRVCVLGTLFFAGEATNTEGHHATVHGAIATGRRAAREIIAAGLLTP